MATASGPGQPPAWLVTIFEIAVHDARGEPFSRRMELRVRVVCARGVAGPGSSIFDAAETRSWMIVSLSPWPGTRASGLRT